MASTPYFAVLMSLVEETHMTKDQIAAEIHKQVPDRDVYDFAEEYDVTLLIARATLEEEAFCDITGMEPDFSTDWRERC
jgi:hypothetical protein